MEFQKRKNKIAVESLVIDVESQENNENEIKPKNLKIDKVL